jgi:hypothetical protein
VTIFLKLHVYWSSTTLLSKSTNNSCANICKKVPLMSTKTYNNNKISNMCKIHRTSSVHGRQISSVSQQTLLESPLCVKHCSALGSTCSLIAVVLQIWEENVLNEDSGCSRVWASEELGTLLRISGGYPAGHMWGRFLCMRFQMRSGDKMRLNSPPPNPPYLPIFAMPTLSLP